MTNAETIPMHCVIDARVLQPGDRVWYLGEIRYVRSVAPSLQKRGFDVTFSNGPAGSFVGSVDTVVDEAWPRRIERAR